MKLFLAADHAGFKLKEQIKKELAKKHEIIDVTPTFKKDDDYPLVAKALVEHLRRGTSDVGRATRSVFICGSGVGAAIASNRYKGIRAAQGYDKKEVKLAREHNDINILTLSGWNTKLKTALELIDVFLKTPTSKAIRHKRRIKQLN
ncbi:MAG: RpiB/LacA/LacB family sugar-phosphate isomerase [Patescibacteria group bacterium]|nr:RpiB/LacA/LacB family sugar-phosphate isomerase [Patescibacteria group bacterium]